ncbi:MAG: helix-turn-helix domain-containing protein [Lachnospiraceae bacterium]|nr:helix-turn-helix domain-containing protein [Clostridiales bacterium]MBR4341808.1 helix-turn-helix domain-containing protein [Lachnospiraceae bacterium]
MENKNTKDVAIADKALLTLEEAAKYFNIGINKLRIMTNDENCPYVVWNGSKRLIKRKPFEEYLYSSYSI